MESVNKLFLEALCASLQNETVDWEEAKTPEQWHGLFRIASMHHVLPMIYESIIRSSAAKKADPRIFIAARRQTIQTVMVQTMKTTAFLRLLSELIAAGVTPIVVKGILCRELYPNPDYRISGDEDILIPEEQADLCHKVMLDCEMYLSDPDQDMRKYEISYRQKGSHLHIELHKQLFPPISDAYGEFNRYFEKVHEQTITKVIQGVAVPSMCHTDHLFYLICHAFKHFLHSGFGIRQVCDICLYANSFGSEIEWFQIMKHCQEIHADLFAAALFRIGEKYLTFQPESACYPQQWRDLSVDEIPMLNELLDSGVFGDSTLSRKHSSNMTLQAFSARNQGKKYGNYALKTVFPPAKDLSGRYPYLQQKPYLLPIAWLNRILKYSQETAEGRTGNNAKESLLIGNKRIELLKIYGIIEE